MVHGHFTFPVAHMGQHDFAVHIADGIDMRHVGLHVLICHDGSPLSLYAQLLQALDLAVGPTAHAHQSLIIGCQLKLSVLFISHDSSRQLFHSGGQMEGHALFLQLFLKQFADLPIIAAQDLIQHLDHGYLRSNLLKISRHLKTNDSASHNQKLLRDLLHIQDLVAGHDRSVRHTFFHTFDRRYCRSRTGSQNQILRCIGLFSYEHHRFSIQSAKLRCSVYYFYLAAAKGTAYALHQHFYNLVFFFHYCSLIHVNRTLRRYTVRFSGSRRVMVHFPRVKKGFCRDTSHIQTGSSQALLFHQQHLLSTVSCVLSAVIPGRTAANNNDIKILHTSFPPCFRCRIACYPSKPSKASAFLPYPDYTFRPRDCQFFIMHFL